VANFFTDFTTDIGGWWDQDFQWSFDYGAGDLGCAITSIYVDLSVVRFGQVFSGGPITVDFTWDESMTYWDEVAYAGVTVRPVTPIVPTRYWKSTYPMAGMCLHQDVLNAYRNTDFIYISSADGGPGRVARMIIHPDTGSVEYWYNNGSIWSHKATYNIFPADANQKFELYFEGWMSNDNYGGTYYDFHSLEITADTFFSYPNQVLCTAQPLVLEALGGPKYIELNFLPLTFEASAGPEFIDATMEPMTCLALSGIQLFDNFANGIDFKHWYEYQAYTSPNTLPYGVIDNSGGLNIPMGLNETQKYFWLYPKLKDDFILTVALWKAVGAYYPSGIRISIEGGSYLFITAHCLSSNPNGEYRVVIWKDKLPYGTPFEADVYTGVNAHDSELNLLELRVEASGQDLIVSYKINTTSTAPWLPVHTLAGILPADHTISVAFYEYYTKYQTAVFKSIAVIGDNIVWRYNAAQTTAIALPIFEAVGRFIDLVSSAPKHFFQLSGLTGGTTDDLDGINPLSIEDSGIPLYAGSVAIVIDLDDNAYFFILYEAPGALHDPPNVIVPAQNPGEFYWQLTECDQLTPAKSFSYDGLSPTPQSFDYGYAGYDIFWTRYDPTYSFGACKGGGDAPVIDVTGVLVPNSAQAGRYNFIAIPQRVDEIYLT